MEQMNSSVLEVAKAPRGRGTGREAKTGPARSGPVEAVVDTINSWARAPRSWARTWRTGPRGRRAIGRIMNVIFDIADQQFARLNAAIEAAGTGTRAAASRWWPTRCASGREETQAATGTWASSISAVQAACTERGNAKATLGPFAGAPSRPGSPG
jgi:hypothetical protein